MPLSPFRTVVTLVTRTKGAPNDFGNDTWTETGRVVLGAFAPGTSTEQVQGKDSLTVQPTLYLGPDVDVSYLDAVIVDGLKYEVDASPNAYAHALTGWTPGIEVKLRRATG